MKGDADDLRLVRRIRQCVRRHVTEKPALVAGILVLACGVLAYWAQVDMSAVFSGDVGLKRVQIANLAEGHPWLAVRGGDFDPARRLFPFRPPFVFTEKGRVFSIYINPVVTTAALSVGLYGDQARY